MSMKSFRKITAAILVITMTSNLAPIGLAQAKMVSTEQVIGQSELTGERARIQDFLLRQDVQEQMILLGINPQEAERRIASLSDDEIRQISGRLDELPAGEGSVVGPIVGAVVLIFLILLITDLLGLTDIFPFVKKKAE